MTKFQTLCRLALVGLLTWTVMVTDARAEIREDGAPATALGVGDAVRATASGASALYFNPAGMSRFRQYAIDAGYNFSNLLDGHTFTTSTVDSATNGLLGMGFGYAYVSSVLSGRDRDGHTLRGALSTGYHGKGFSILAGVAVRYASLAIGAADSEENGEVDDVEFVTLDVGLMGTIGSVFSFGVVGKNLIDTKFLVEGPRAVAFGIAGHYKGFQVSADLDLDLQSGSDDKPIVGYAFGAQYVVKQMIVLRLGFSGGGFSGEKKISAGAAYVSKLVGVDLGVRHNLDNTSDTSFGLGVKVFLP